MHIVYVHTNVHNGKRYVGVTPKRSEPLGDDDLNNKAFSLMIKRWQSHCSAMRAGSELVFHRAIRKYGENSFKHMVLQQCSSLKEALQHEIRLIAELNSTIDGNGYNMTKGGGGNVMTESQRIKHRICCKKSHNRPEVIARLIEAQNRPDVKKRKSIAIKQAFNNHFTRQQKSINQKRVMSDPKIRANVSLKLKKYCADPDVRKARSIRSKEVMARPEVLIKKCKQINQIDTKSGVVIKTFSSARTASNETGINHGNMCNCARGIVPRAGGFDWKYV